jgi:hypothetical protein
MFIRARLPVAPVCGDRAIGERNAAALALAHHEEDPVGQKSRGFHGILDLAGARQKIEGDLHRLFQQQGRIVSEPG